MEQVSPEYDSSIIQVSPGYHRSVTRVLRGYHVNRGLRCAFCELCFVLFRARAGGTHLQCLVAMEMAMADAALLFTFSSSSCFLKSSPYAFFRSRPLWCLWSGLLLVLWRGLLLVLRRALIEPVSERVSCNRAEGRLEAVRNGLQVFNHF